MLDTYACLLLFGVLLGFPQLELLRIQDLFWQARHIASCEPNPRPPPVTTYSGMTIQMNQLRLVTRAVAKLCPTFALCF